MSLDRFDVVQCQRPLRAENAMGAAVLEGMQGVILGVTDECPLDHDRCYWVWFEDGTQRWHLMEPGEIEQVVAEEPAGDGSVVGCLAFAAGVVVGVLAVLIVLAVL